MRPPRRPQQSDAAKSAVAGNGAICGVLACCLIGRRGDRRSALRAAIRARFPSRIGSTLIVPPCTSRVCVRSRREPEPLNNVSCFRLRSFELPFCFVWFHGWPVNLCAGLLEASSCSDAQGMSNLMRETHLIGTVQWSANMLHTDSIEWQHIALLSFVTTAVLAAVCPASLEADCPNITGHTAAAAASAKSCGETNVTTTTAAHSRRCLCRAP